MNKLVDGRSKVLDLLELLRSCGSLDLEAAIEEREGYGAGDERLSVELTGPDAELLTSRNGELLHAIEHLAAKILRLDPEEHDLIRFDADEFKAKRDETLRRQAAQAISSVLATSKPFTFPPMSSRERRLLHLAIAPSGLQSASSGDGARRCVVLYPRRAVADRN
jgi:spoIIIJ-associated protein